MSEIAVKRYGVSVVITSEMLEESWSLRHQLDLPEDQKWHKKSESLKKKKGKGYY